MRNYINNIEDSLLNNRTKKIVLVSTMFFLVLLVQNITRTIKNSLVVVLIQPEVISFIKFYIELPITALVTFIYIKICDKYLPATIFYFTIIGFIFCFSIFGFWLIPNYENYKLSDQLITSWIANHSPMKWFFLILQNWVIAIFYVIGELWTSLAYTLLLWEFINRITTIQDSKTQYPIFNFFGQFSTSISGVIILFAFNSLPGANISLDFFSPTLVRFLMSLVVISLAVILLVH